jgi:hypothetical protein
MPTREVILKHSHEPILGVIAFLRAGWELGDWVLEVWGRWVPEYEIWMGHEVRDAL